MRPEVGSEGCCQEIICLTLVAEYPDLTTIWSLTITGGVAETCLITLGEL